MQDDFHKLADLYAQAKARADAAAEELEALRKQILETGSDKVLGDFYMVAVNISERVTIDSKKVREILTPDQVASVSRTSEILSLRVKPVAH